MIKVIASLTMTIDHIGQIFYPDITILTLIGRLSFPLFTWGIASGIKRTQNFKRYALRLFLLAIISQVPYYYLFNNDYINVVFTLLSGLIILIIFETRLNIVIKYISICTIALISDALFF
ncbi:TraX family protein [Bacillus sp. SM2101]|uniref:TraX family protein n=1 Tax=Bacillus sp. SM2101 TaxID=2805366 RepID=UPI001BDE3D2A